MPAGVTEHTLNFGAQKLKEEKKKKVVKIEETKKKSDEE